MEVPTGQMGNIEAAFENENVLKALRNTGWFTPEHITQIVKTEPNPELNPDFTFKDERLRKFLKAPFPADSSVVREIAEFLSRSLLTRDGNTRPFRYIPYTDKEFLAYASSLLKPKSLASIENFSLDRLTEPAMPLMCMIAPKEIRRKVVKDLCGWGEGQDWIKNNALLWSDLSRRGIKQYLDEHYPTGVKKLLKRLTGRKTE